MQPPFIDRALMGLSTLSALGLEMAISEVRIVTGEPSVKLETTACIRCVVAATDYEIPARSKVVLPARVISQGPDGPVMIGLMSNECEHPSVTRPVSKVRGGLCNAHVLNPSDNPVQTQGRRKLSPSRKGLHCYFKTRSTRP